MAPDVPHRYATRVLAENLGKPSLWVIINEIWYKISCGFPDTLEKLGLVPDQLGNKRHRLSLGVNLRHPQPCPECRLLGVGRSKSTRKRTLASECRLMWDKRTCRRHGPDFRVWPQAEVRDAAGIQDFTLHDCRHSYAIWVRPVGQDLIPRSADRSRSMEGSQVCPTRHSPIFARTTQRRGWSPAQ